MTSKAKVETPAKSNSEHNMTANFENESDDFELAKPEFGPTDSILQVAPHDEEQDFTGSIIESENPMKQSIFSFENENENSPESSKK